MLPLEIWSHVFLFLDFESWMSCLEVSTTFRDAALVDVNDRLKYYFFQEVTVKLLPLTEEKEIKTTRIGLLMIWVISILIGKLINVTLIKKLL